MFYIFHQALTLFTHLPDMSTNPIIVPENSLANSSLFFLRSRATSIRCSHGKPETPHGNEALSYKNVFRRSVEIRSIAASGTRGSTRCSTSPLPLLAAYRFLHFQTVRMSDRDWDYLGTIRPLFGDQRRGFEAHRSPVADADFLRVNRW